MALAAFHVKVNVNCETWHQLGLTQGSSISVQFCKQEDNGLIGFRAHIYIFNIIIQSCSIYSVKLNQESESAHLRRLGNFPQISRNLYYIIYRKS